MRLCDLVRVCVVIYDYMLLCAVMCACVRLCVVVWLYVVECGYGWLCVVICGCVWLCGRVVVRGCVCHVTSESEKRPKYILGVAVGGPLKSHFLSCK